jgi:hypothetical protein
LPFFSAANFIATQVFGVRKSPSEPHGTDSLNARCLTVGAACRRASRVGSRDSVGEANGDALKWRKASIEAFLDANASPAYGRRRGYQVSKRVGKPLLWNKNT